LHELTDGAETAQPNETCVSKSEWHEVSDLMPDFDEPVMVRGSTHADIGIGVLLHIFGYGISWHVRPLWSETYETKKGITHWCKIPEQDD
jgi:hypothetical protein